MYIEGQYQKFESRNKQGKLLPIPELFSRFNKGGENNKDGYNDWITKWSKAPQMSRQGLEDHAEKLISVIIAIPGLQQGNGRPSRKESKV